MPKPPAKPTKKPAPKKPSPKAPQDPNATQGQQQPVDPMQQAMGQDPMAQDPMGQQQDPMAQQQDPMTQMQNPQMGQDPMAMQGPPVMQSAVPLKDYDLPDHTIDGFPMPQQGSEGEARQPGGTPEVGRLPKPEWWEENDNMMDEPSPWPRRQLDSRPRTMEDINDDLVARNRVQQDDMSQDPMGGLSPRRPNSNLANNWINSPDMTGEEEEHPLKRRLKRGIGTNETQW